MNFKSITSKDNSLIKLVSSLQSSAKSRRENGLFAIEGIRICDDAMCNGIRFDKLIFSENSLEKYREKIEQFSKNANEVYCISENLLEKISNTQTPQGVICVCSFDAVKKHDFDKKGRYIALENLSDPSNLGAISRTAEALGVSGIIITSSSVDIFSPKVLRSSMGTVLRLPIYITDDLNSFLKNNSIYYYACVVGEKAKEINEITFSDGCAILIGNEANGLESYTSNNANEKITIGMRGNVESLNASVAAAIAMWEMMR